ncbi:hypothetical protein CH252_40655 [Rhodococcus sp. 06-1477-1B]|nr:hypothetical protein CH252_40655 [Rhodococcus sp. 06-1477-1B]
MVEAVFTGVGDRTWYGLLLEEGTISVGDIVGVYPPDATSVKVDAQVLAIRRNGQGAETAKANPTGIVRCAVELAAQPADVAPGSRLGKNLKEHATSYGLAADDLP